ncbi:MAG: hypothetical protein M9894_16290 [Planctomycetes bacterium]|nr:hypothetical protein [Planctomycetota bacterium]
MSRGVRLEAGVLDLSDGRRVKVSVEVDLARVARSAVRAARSGGGRVRLGEGLVTVTAVCPLCGWPLSRRCRHPEGRHERQASAP